MKPDLRQPIVVLGAARSGTTLTAEILERHPDLAYWVEPKYVWRYGRPLARDDRREAREATPTVRRYIRNSFARFAERRGKARFMEKTPSNCFRVPFVHAVLPDARFLHILRDGRDVTRSAVKKWTTPPDPTAIRRRMTSFEIPLRDAPFYAVDAVRDVVGRQFLPKQAFIWGPHFPGIREVRAAEGVEAACALQWRESVRAAREGLAVVPEDQKLEIRFEDLVGDPEPVLARILDFLQLPPSEEVLSYARATVKPDAASRWERRESDPELEGRLEPVLSALGYT